VSVKIIDCPSSLPFYSEISQQNISQQNSATTVKKWELSICTESYHSTDINKHIHVKASSSSILQLLDVKEDTLQSFATVDTACGLLEIQLQQRQGFSSKLVEPDWAYPHAYQFPSMVNWDYADTSPQKLAWTFKGK